MRLEIDPRAGSSLFSLTGLDSLERSDLNLSSRQSSDSDRRGGPDFGWVVKRTVARLPEAFLCI